MQPKEAASYYSMCICEKCYWSSQCKDYAITSCDDFTPLDDESEVRFYIDDCGERQDEYSAIVAQF